MQNVSKTLSQWKKAGCCGMHLSSQDSGKHNRRIEVQVVLGKKQDSISKIIVQKGLEAWLKW
jgi:hypothetical protein